MTDGMRYALALLLALTAGEAAAGAWALRPGEGKAALGYSRLSAGSVLDGIGAKRRYGVTEQAIGAFGEIGITRALAAGWAWAPLKHAETDSFSRAAPTDAEASVSWHLHSARGWQFAAQGLALIPAGPGNPAAAPDYLYGVHSHGAWGFEARPLLGWSGGRAWAQGGTGIRVRTHGLAAQWRYSLAGGGALIGRIGWMASLSGVIPLDTRPAGRPGDQEKYLGWQAGLDYRLSSRLRIGAQLDELAGSARELPLGARWNAYVGWGWGKSP